MIGIIDSNFTGLSSLVELRKVYPEHDFIYFCDNGRSPYGDKSSETILDNTEEVVEFLFKKGCEVIICTDHASCASAIRTIEERLMPRHYPGKFLFNPLNYLANKAMEALKNKSKLNGNKNRIGVIGSLALIKSSYYKDYIVSINSDLEVLEQESPLLGALVENNWISRPETKMIIKNYTRKLKMKEIKVLVASDSSYSYLSKDINRIMGQSIEVIYDNQVIADGFTKFLNNNPKLLDNLSQNKKTFFYTTDDPEKFHGFNNKYFKLDMKYVTRAKL